MEGIHVYGGLPWWGAILTTSLVARLLLFPMFVKTSDSFARTAALGEVLKPYDDALRAAQKANDSQGMLLAMKRKGEVKRRAGIISAPKQFAPMILQGVIAYCGIRLTRAMANLPVPGLQDGGFLWLKDLTITDGYLLLPIIMAGTLHMVARTGGETGAAAQLGPMMKPAMLWFMPGLVAIFMSFQPGAVCVWFCGSGIIGLGQGLILRNNKVRDYLGMAPNFTPKVGMEPAGTLKTMLEDQFPGLSKRSEAFSAEPSAPPKSTGPYMNPTYQAPEVRRKPSKLIDTTLVKKVDEMIQPDGSSSASSPPKPSLREKWSKFTTMTEEDKKAAAKKAFKKRAAQYERQAQEKGRR
jgi:YidC/Oxa1 family membrane protein insertase